MNIFPDVFLYMKIKEFLKQMGGGTIIGQLKKVVWTFPERNGKSLSGW